MIQTGLRYSMQDEAIYVSTEEGLRGDVLMKIYDISDLTLPLTSFPGPRLAIPEPGEAANILKISLMMKLQISRSSLILFRK